MGRIYPSCFDMRRRKTDKGKCGGSAACRRAALLLLFPLFTVMLLLASCSAGTAAGETGSGDSRHIFLMWARRMLHCLFPGEKQC